MNTIIRCHIKNEERLKGLEREIQSWLDKKLDTLGELYLIDDGSPLKKELLDLAANYRISVWSPEGKPDTKHGLYASLKFHRDMLYKKDYVLCCVDDAVFGKGITERLKFFFKNEEKQLPNLGMLGMFACYEDSTRNPNRIGTLGVWKVPLPILYALVCHVFSPILQNIIIESWENIQKGIEPYPQMCDDLWVKELCKKNDLSVYNTMLDYAQHTGGTNRTFGESTDNSEYITKMFIGE